MAGKLVDMTPTKTNSHPVSCLRCGRTLRSAASIRHGYGAWCRARIRAAAIAEAVKDFSAAQVDKARELIADKGIVPANRAGIFRAVSSDGTQNYLVAVSGNCNCRAGLLARPCYHVAAARMVTAKVA
jgi:hypothetical protein